MQGFKPRFGFTLIELMITVAVIAILASIALPSYRNYVLKSGRAEAKTALLEGAQVLERCFTRFSAYDAAGCATQRTAIDGELGENGKYQLDIDTITPTTFTLTATPKGGQTDDKCGTYTLTHTGARSVDGDDSLGDCW